MEVHCHDIQDGSGNPLTVAWFLMQQVGSPFTYREDVKPEDILGMCLVLSQLHSDGCVHGDVRFRNFVKFFVESKAVYRLVDLRTVGLRSTSGIKDDFRMLFESVKMDFDEELLLAYADSLFKGHLSETDRCQVIIKLVQGLIIV